MSIVFIAPIFCYWIKIFYLHSPKTMDFQAFFKLDYYPYYKCWFEFKRINSGYYCLFIQEPMYSWLFVNRVKSPLLYTFYIILCCFNVHISLNNSLKNWLHIIFCIYITEWIKTHLLSKDIYCVIFALYCRSILYKKMLYLFPIGTNVA